MFKYTKNNIYGGDIMVIDKIPTDKEIEQTVEEVLKMFYGE